MNGCVEHCLCGQFILVSFFFLPRQQALFHVLSAYSVYNTVSSKLVQLKCKALS